MGDRIRKWIAVLLAGSILAMIQLVPAGGAVFVRENIENKEILGEKETSLQQTLHARAWVLMDADSGRILAEKDADTAYPMASTTKILTCILALEQGNPDDWVGVSEKAASMPDVQLNMRAGERYRLSDLLYSLMLESHNDIRCDSRVFKCLSQQCHSLLKFFRGIMTVHSLQCSLAATLERKMEMRTYCL